MSILLQFENTSMSRTDSSFWDALLKQYSWFIWRRNFVLRSSSSDCLESVSFLALSGFAQRFVADYLLLIDRVYIFTACVVLIFFVQYESVLVSEPTKVQLNSASLDVKSRSIYDHYLSLSTIVLGWFTVNPHILFSLISLQLFQCNLCTSLVHKSFAVFCLYLSP